MSLILLVVGFIVLIGITGLVLAFTIGGLNHSPLSSSLLGSHKDKVAVIYLEGQMAADKSSGDTDVACSGDIVRYLKKATDDADVKAIVIRINSPGGTPVAAEEIIDQIDKTKVTKPVVVSMGDMATSAAYFVSANTNYIIANPDTFTGSIGVIWVFKNRTKYYGDEGVNYYVAKSGNFKDMGSDWRGLSDSEKDYVQSIINESYGRFVSSVAAGRNLTDNYVRSIADGRVYTGNRAKEMGLVDQLGGLYDAVNAAAKLANMTGTPSVTYINAPS